MDFSKIPGLTPRERDYTRLYIQLGEELGDAPSRSRMAAEMGLSLSRVSALHGGIVAKAQTAKAQAQHLTALQAITEAEPEAEPTETLTAEMEGLREALQTAVGRLYPGTGIEARLTQESSGRPVITLSRVVSVSLPVGAGGLAMGAAVRRCGEALTRIGHPIP